MSSRGSWRLVGRFLLSGGGIRCRGLDCTKLAQSRGLCVAHGGGRRCAFEGCGKLAQYKVLCLSHGGGRRCCVPDCQKFVQIRGLCKAHLKYLEGDNSTRQPTTTGSRFTALYQAPLPSASKLAIAFLMNPYEHPKTSPQKKRAAALSSNLNRSIVATSIFNPIVKVAVRDQEPAFHLPNSVGSSGRKVALCSDQDFREHCYPPFVLHCRGQPR